MFIYLHLNTIEHLYTSEKKWVRITYFLSLLILLLHIIDYNYNLGKVNRVKWTNELNKSDDFIQREEHKGFQFVFLCAGINSEVKYSLLSGDDGYFSLDEFSGILRLERPLTPETPPSFELKVKATDRGLPRHLYSVATVTVDVVSLDDYQPVFLSSGYTAQLPESSEVGSEVLSISALTKDGGGPDPIVYRIISGNEDGRFLLDSRTGQNTWLHII